MPEPARYDLSVAMTRRGMAAILPILVGCSSEASPDSVAGPEVAPVQEGGGGGGGGLVFDAAASDAAPDACAASEVSAILVKKPVDLILVIDTSGSMSGVTSAVEQNINANLASILTGNSLDLHVIVLSAYGAGAAVCIDPPVGVTSCSPPAAKPGSSSSFVHYQYSTGSGSLLQFPTTYTTPDSLGVAPNGWAPWIRQDSLKVIMAFSDTASTSGWSAQTFDQKLLALDPVAFGTAQQRNYVFHSFIGIAKNNPPTNPYLPSDPLVSGNCYGKSGPEEQKVSILSGGLRFPICVSDSFDVVFKTVADSVLALTPVACDLPLPTPPNGVSIDPDTIQLLYTPGDGSGSELFNQVKGLSDCTSSAFYVENSMIHLCPNACKTVQADTAAKIGISYGCDVGFVK